MNRHIEDAFEIKLSQYHLSGYSIRLLFPDDCGKIFSFLDQNREYFLLENGRSPVHADGKSFIEDLPPNKPPSDKFAIAFEKDNRITALVDLVRGYPEEHIWWIGLLLIHPSSRGMGLGSRIIRLLDHLVFALGGREIRLGVLSENDPGFQFWKTMGFEQIQTSEGLVIGEKSHTVYIMSKELAQTQKPENFIF